MLNGRRIVLLSLRPERPGEDIYLLLPSAVRYTTQHRLPCGSVEEIIYQPGWWCAADKFGDLWEGSD